MIFFFHFNGGFQTNLTGTIAKIFIFWEKWWEKKILIGKIIFTPEINLKSTSLIVKTCSQQLYCLTMTLLKLLGFSKHMYATKIVIFFGVLRIPFDKSKVIYGLYEYYLKITCFYFALNNYFKAWLLQITSHQDNRSLTIISTNYQSKIS